MKYRILTAFSFFAVLQFSLCAQSLSVSGPNSFNITSPTHLSANVVPSLERVPTGMAFGDSGTKLYLIGTGGDMVVQYDLSTAYDPSTRGTIQNYFRVNGEDGAPEDILFNDNDGASSGTKMYILGGAGDDVTEYTLSTAWDVSSIDTGTNPPIVYNTEAEIETFLGTFGGSVADRHTGMRFNNDGTKLFIVDRRADRVFEFSLSTAYDISTTGTVDASLNINSQDGNPRSIEFNNDGSKLYMIGNASDQIHTYSLNSNYNISSIGTITSSVSTNAQDNVPQALLIDDDGDNFYIAGSDNDLLYTYSFTGTTYDFLSISFDSSNSFPTVEIQPRGMVFNPDGTKLFVAGDQLNVVSELALSTPYDISTATFTAGLYVNSEETNINGLAFDDGAATNPGRRLFIIGTQNDEINEYDLTTAYDLTSTVTYDVSSPYSVASFDTGPTDIYFNNDGTKVYVLGNQGNDINQFSLSPAYDMADVILANLEIAYPLNNVSGLVIDATPTGMAFNTTGNKLYVAGNQGDDINEITLTNNFDLSSGIITNTNTFSVSTEEASIHDVVFKPDGSIFFISGLTGDDMNQYQTKGTYNEESSTNNGTLLDPTSLVFTLTGDTFADADTDNLLDVTTEFTITNLPEGITPVMTLTSGDTEATLTFTGVAAAHLNSNDVANLVFTFTDAAFTSSSAADLGAENLSLMDIDFIDCPSDILYNGSTWSGGSGGSGEPTTADTTKGVRIQGDVTLAADVDCFCVHVETGNTLSVATGLELNISGSLELVGDLRLLGTSQLKQTHTGVKNVPGSGNLYKDVTGTLSNVYQTGYWSSPVTTNGNTFNIAGVLKDGTTALTTSNTPLDITFTSDFDGDEATSPITLSRRWLAKFINSGSWTTEIDESTELFNPGEGFNKKSTGASGQNYTFVGIPNDGDYEHTIGTFGSGRWSMLGNPYSSTINADTFIFDNATTANSIVGTLYFYEAGEDTSHNTSEYLGGYATRVSGMGTPAAELGGSGKTPGQNIGIGQGFFVEASGSGGIITFNNAQRVFDISGASTEFFGKHKNAKKEVVSFPILRIGFEFLLEGKNYNRQVAIGFRGLSNEYENGYEAEMWDYKSTDMALKIEEKELPYVITGIEDFNSSLIIPLKVRSNTNRDITFKIDESDLESDVYLFDSLTNNYYNISFSTATISVLEGNYDNRFFITFNKATLGLEDNDNDLTGIKIFTKDKELVVFSKYLLNEILIYNLLGQKKYVQDNSLKNYEVKIKTSNFKEGVYLVKTTNKKGSYTKKIIIH